MGKLKDILKEEICEGSCEYTGNVWYCKDCGHVGYVEKRIKEIMVYKKGGKMKIRVKIVSWWERLNNSDNCIITGIILIVIAIILVVIHGCLNVPK